MNVSRDLNEEQRQQAERLIDQILKTLERKPVDLSPEAVARKIEDAANQTLRHGSPLHRRALEAVENMRKK